MSFTGASDMPSSTAKPLCKYFLDNLSHPICNCSMPDLTITMAELGDKAGNEHRVTCAMPVDMINYMHMHKANNHGSGKPVVAQDHDALRNCMTSEIARKVDEHCTTVHV